MREDHGTLFYNPDLSLWTMATYHPSAVGRDPSLTADFASDLSRFFRLADPLHPAYKVVEDPDSIPLQGMQKVYIDIETTGLEWTDDITAIGIKPDDVDVVYQIENPSNVVVKRLMQRLKDNEVLPVMHNAQFDLVRLCIKGGTSWLTPVRDTMLLAHSRGDTDGLSLKHLTSRYTDRPGSRCWGGWDSPEYLAEDVLSTAELEHTFEPWTRIPIAPVIERVLPMISMMQIRGVYIDLVQLSEYQHYYDEKIAEAQSALAPFGPAGINWNSPMQAVPAFLEAGVPLIEKTPTGSFSLAEPAIISYKGKYELVDRYLDLKEALKNRGFITWYQAHTSEDHPYLHPLLKIHGTDTGRLSCTEPNLQQVPRIGPIKKIFTTRQSGGTIGLIDLAQAELRVVAMLSNDKRLVEALGSSDVHLTIASQVFRKKPEDVTPAERKKSKGITFGLLYGGSPAGLAAKVNSTPREVQHILESFFGLFPDLSKWLDNVKQRSIETSSVETLFGRRRDLTNIIREEGISGAHRKAINTPVQSVASDIMLMILDHTGNELIRRKMKTRPLFLVHDSMLLEIPPGEEEAVAEVVQSAFINLQNSPLSSLPLYDQLPLLGELKIAQSWAHAESTNEFYHPLKEFDMSSHGKEN
jgi:DNA polymerase I-like protein with 3'-5' exonuclease and polymerase domains